MNYFKEDKDIILTVEDFDFTMAVQRNTQLRTKRSTRNSGIDIESCISKSPVSLPGLGNGDGDCKSSLESNLELRSDTREPEISAACLQDVPNTGDTSKDCFFKNDENSTIRRKIQIRKPKKSSEIRNVTGGQNKRQSLPACKKQAQSSKRAICKNKMCVLNSDSSENKVCRRSSRIRKICFKDELLSEPKTEQNDKQIEPFLEHQTSMEIVKCTESSCSRIPAATNKNLSVAEMQRNVMASESASEQRASTMDVTVSQMCREKPFTSTKGMCLCIYLFSRMFRVPTL